MAGEQQLSELAHRIRELTDGTPEREAYLERLAAEIREGCYELDAEILAQKLIERGVLSDPKSSEPQSSISEEGNG